MENKPEPIKNIIGSVLNKLERGKSDIKNSLSDVWKEVTKQELCRNTKVMNFEKGVLEVKVFNSSYLYKLTLSKRRLIKKVNKKMGKSVVEDINFRI